MNNLKTISALSMLLLLLGNTFSAFSVVYPATNLYSIASGSSDVTPIGYVGSNIYVLNGVNNQILLNYTAFNSNATVNLLVFTPNATSYLIPSNFSNAGVYTLFSLTDNSSTSFSIYSQSLLPSTLVNSAFDTQINNLNNSYNLQGNSISQLANGINSVNSSINSINSNVVATNSLVGMLQSNINSLPTIYATQNSLSNFVNQTQFNGLVSTEATDNVTLSSHLSNLSGYVIGQIDNVNSTLYTNSTLSKFINSIDENHTQVEYVIGGIALLTAIVVFFPKIKAVMNRPKKTKDEKMKEEVEKRVEAEVKVTDDAKKDEIDNNKKITDLKTSTKAIIEKSDKSNKELKNKNSIRLQLNKDKKYLDLKERFEVAKKGLDASLSDKPDKIDLSSLPEYIAMDEYLKTNYPELNETESV